MSSSMDKFERIQVDGGSLAAWSVGAGAPLVFLHGGPGDTHDYMRRMAEPLVSKFRCIFFDQRGTGFSNDFKRLASGFTVEAMLDDLETLVEFFDLDSPAVVGHSWGAMYGLFACVARPKLFSRAALISMGPLDAEMARGTSDHLVAALSAEERVQWAELRERRNEARDEGDIGRVVEADRELMMLRVKSWVVNPSLRGPFLQEYFLDPPPDRQVNKWIWTHAEDWFQWPMLSSIEANVWLCTGAGDSTPIEQTNRLAKGIGNNSVAIFDQCGHMPYLEHPDRFYFELENFLFQGERKT